MMEQFYTESMTGEERTVRCCDCKGYVNSIFASVINHYKKECRLNRKFVYPMQKPCEKFDAAYPSNVYSINSDTKRTEK